MKKYKSLIMFLSLGMLFSCSRVTESNDKIKENAVKISGLGDNLILVDDDHNLFNFEIFKEYRILIFIKDFEINQNLSFYQDIKFEYNNEISKITYATYNSYDNYFSFKFISNEVSINNGLSISYIVGSKKYDYSFSYKVIDYNFESIKASKPTIDEIKDHKELSTLIDSITYYEFKEPYQGLNDNYSRDRDYYKYSYQFKVENEKYVYDTSYLEFMIDSFYYPKFVDLVNDNPIAGRDLTLYFEDENQVIKGASASKFARFEIDYGVIDPGCTNPQNPLSYFSYAVAPLNYEYKSKTLEDLNNNNILYVNLLNKYPEMYYTYVVNDIYINIIRVRNNFYGVFKDDNYSYRITFYYD